MWGPTKPVDEDVSAPLGIDAQNKRSRRRRAWGDGLADQTVVQTLEDVRSYRAFERALMSSVDPRSVLGLALAHQLTSLLWRLCRASAIERACLRSRANFRSHAGRIYPAGGLMDQACNKSLRSMAMAKAPVRTVDTICKKATKSRNQRPWVRR